jgi:hypothetical protein
MGFPLLLPLSSASGCLEARQEPQFVKRNRFSVSERLPFVISLLI